MPKYIVSENICLTVSSTINTRSVYPLGFICIKKKNILQNKCLNGLGDLFSTSFWSQLIR